MACEGAYATAQDFVEFWNISCMGNDQEMQLDRMLELAAGNIHAARAASGGCDCDLAPHAHAMLQQLNIISAAVTYKNVCGLQLSADEKRIYLEWVNTQLSLIRKGEIELCANATGAEFPAMAIAQQGFTEWSSARIKWAKK